MTKTQLIETFARLNESELRKEASLAERYRVATHGDLCAFILLDRLVPAGKVAHPPGRTHAMVSSAGHDQIWLRTGLDELAAAATEDDVRALLQCGVVLDAETESLSMFV